MSEAVVRLFADELESSLQIDAVGGGENALRPESDLAIAGGARELNALVDEGLAESEAARGGFDEEQAEFGGVSVFWVVDEEDAAEGDSVALSDPAAVALGLILIDEIGGDAGDECFHGFIPAVFLRVESAVTLDDPAHVSGAMIAQDVRGSCGLGGEGFFDGAHGVKQVVAPGRRNALENFLSLSF